MTDAMVNKMKSVAVQHCNDDKWDAAVLKCFVDGKVADDIEKCDKGLTKDQKEKFDKDLEAAMAAMMPKDGSGAAPAGAAGGDGDLPAECKDYKAAMEKLAACDKLPKESKDALKQGYDAMSQGWAQVGALPPEAKKAMADGCKQGADALVQTGKALCGW